ncbi:MAG: sulfite oxidase [Acidobacteria bacterium]|nr:sulfite oxidase [Acidobacteriota bacterium]
MGLLDRRQMLVFSTLGPAFTRYAAAMAQEADEVIPFADTTPFNPERPRLPWEQTTAWITPKDHFFRVGHYGFPDVDAAKWKLDIAGLVERPRSFTLDELKKRKLVEKATTIECSGNPAAGGLIGNARWKGTPLAPLLKECGVKPEGIEAVFFAADNGVEKIRGAEYTQHFARSLSVREAIKDTLLLAWEMNGEPLAKHHGAPVRLIVPGWYGICWVKWLERIEIHDRAFLSRFMGRDYVTIRGEKQGGQTIWRETSVGRMNLKAVVGRAVRRNNGVIRIMGAAWSDGTPLQKVELRIDEVPWMPAALSRENSAPFCWTFWSHDWKDARPGEHTLVARAIDVRGKTQPGPDDALITMKKTYWEANQQAVRKIKL